MSDLGHLDEVGGIARALTIFGAQPTLVGGMALVVLGSRRVTHDFDFVIAHPRERVGELVDLLYERGFELASRIDDRGEVSATIDNRRVATIRLRLDAPVNASFFNATRQLRIDLLFDFPIAASELAERATRRTIGSVTLHIASADDLLRLKRIAHADRASSRDAQDIEFLETHLLRK